MERDTRTGRFQLTEQYYLITRDGLLDVASRLMEDVRDEVLANLRTITDDSYGSLSAQPIQVAAVDGGDIGDFDPETIAGFGRFFDRHDTERAIIARWTEDGETFHYFLGDGRLVFFEEALGLIPRGSVPAVRDNLESIFAGDARPAGMGKLLYVPLTTLATREDMLKAAKDLFATVLDDRGYEMIAMLQWTGRALPGGADRHLALRQPQPLKLCSPATRRGGRVPKPERQEAEMVLQKLTATQKPYLRWHKDNLGFTFAQQDDLEQLNEVFIVPFNIASLSLFSYLDKCGVAVVSENPYHGDGKALGDPHWNKAYPENVKTAKLKCVETNRRPFTPFSWYSWTGRESPAKPGHSLLAKNLKVIYEVTDLLGSHDFIVEPEVFVAEGNVTGTYAVVRREGSNVIDTPLVEQVSRELLEWHVDRTPPHQASHDEKLREYAVAKLAVQCSLISGRFDVALNYAATFFDMPQSMLAAGAEMIADRQRQ